MLFQYWNQISDPLHLSRARKRDRERGRERETESRMFFFHQKQRRHNCGQFYYKRVSLVEGASNIHIRHPTHNVQQFAMQTKIRSKNMLSHIKAMCQIICMECRSSLLFAHCISVYYCSEASDTGKHQPNIGCAQHRLQLLFLTQALYRQNKIQK